MIAVRKTCLPLIVTPLALAACNEAYDPRGVDHDETLLSVSATGESEVRPDEAFFQVGVENFARTGKAASDANAEDIREVVAALREAGVPADDIQTRTVGIQRIQYGDRKGQYQANNIVAVTVRDIEKAGDAVTAATEAGANVFSGPDLRISDSEKAANTAYGEAFKAAKARAQAYADAADMEIARVLTIRDGGGAQGGRYIPGAPPPPPPPVSMPVRTQAMPEEQAGGVIQPGQTTSRVSVQVDFALVPK